MLQTSPSEDSIELLRETGAALFVINLCASTTPVTLSHPATAELKRFTFFVTRKREEGRERFRLHMGYFDTLVAAEEMLAAVRDVYPAAWAGPAPENRAPPARVAPPKPVVSIVPPPAEVSARPAPVVPAPVKAVELETMSNVREVLAELADEPRAKIATTPAAKQPVVEAAPLTPAQTLRILETPAAPAPAPVRAPAADAASSSTVNKIRVLTPEDTQTLRDIKLDAQRNAPASYAVQLLWAVQPIDMEALPHLAIFDAYTLYHVEGNRQGRRWYGLRLGFFTDAGAAKQVAQYVRSEYASVAIVPVTAKEKDGARAPTLSAAPVQQKAAVRREAPKIPTVKPVGKTPPGSLDGFELLPDAPVAAKRDLEDAVAPKTAPQAPKATGKAPGKRAIARPNRKPPPPGAAQPLESTLEILGASTLTIDESREIVNDAAARHAKPPKKDKPGRFARLLNRLSDKAG
jgi:hypothetical protein